MINQVCYKFRRIVRFCWGHTYIPLTLNTPLAYFVVEKFGEGEEGMSGMLNHIPIMSACILCLDKLVKPGKGRNLQKAHGKIRTCLEAVYILAFNPFVGIIYQGVFFA